MPSSEAWLVTALGMGVVFIGLMLCILAINFFNILARRIRWEEHGAPEPAAPAPAPEPDPAPPAEPVPAEILAVIAAALEIDRRLHASTQGQRLTLRRNDA